MVAKKEKLNVDRLYAVLCVALLGWLVFELLFYILKDPYWIEYVYTAKHMFVTFIPPLFFFLVAGFYRLRDMIPRWFQYTLLVLPAITAVICATCMHHQLFRENFEVLSTGPLTMVSSSWGPWYIVNLISSQVPVALIVFIFITQYKKLSGAYRASMNLLLFAFVVYLLGFIVEMAGLDGHNTLDFNLVSICLTNFIFYIAVSSNGRADYLNIWRRNIFDYLDEAALILNDAGIVVEANEAAHRMLDGVAAVVEGVPETTFFNQALLDGKITIRDVHGKEEQMSGKDLYIMTEKYPIIYNMRRLPIPGGAGMESGAFITFTEVTQNRLLIERMQETAGLDSLTGLKNRFGYEHMLRELDQPDNFPLSIIFGDVNGLKSVNDLYGHEAGDLLLQKVAAILLTNFPGKNIARIGGDEFIVLIQDCPATVAEAEIRKLQSAVEGASDFPYPISIAWGSATKTDGNENINQLIMRADERMYLHKETGEAEANE